jgi:glucose-1-phosphate cytidylyltransferase
VSAAGRSPAIDQPLKVVLFCGGQGLRLREYADGTIPKPMAPIGLRPVLWHVMRYYSHFGVNDFVLCLGHKGEVIKDYFLRYNEAVSNDFVLLQGGRSLELLSTDIEDWRITFADTGQEATIAQRLLSVRRHVENEEMFLANYADVLTDAPLDRFVADFRHRDKVAAFISVRPNYTFHMVETDGDDTVSSIRHVRESDVWINGGYFILRREIFDYIRPGEELVEAPFQRLVEEGQLLTYRYEGFWEPMDTLKEMQHLEALYQGGRPPWAVWQHREADPSAG